MTRSGALLNGVVGPTRSLSTLATNRFASATRSTSSAVASTVHSIRARRSARSSVGLRSWRSCRSSRNRRTTRAIAHSCCASRRGLWPTTLLREKKAVGQGPPYDFAIPVGEDADIAGNCSCISAGQEPQCRGGHGWPGAAGIPSIHGHRRKMLLHFRHTVHPWTSPENAPAFPAYRPSRDIKKPGHWPGFRYVQLVRPTLRLDCHEPRNFVADRHLHLREVLACVVRDERQRGVRRADAQETIVAVRRG